MSANKEQAQAAIDAALKSDAINIAVQQLLDPTTRLTQEHDFGFSLGIGSSQTYKHGNFSVQIQIVISAEISRSDESRMWQSLLPDLPTPNP